MRESSNMLTIYIHKYIYTHIFIDRDRKTGGNTGIEKLNGVKE